ncbi:hypothetical protein QR680_006112 [Steinernema hermaphroditum]|uniref:Uncharacterized protein n=1 Tax=Steinernema hermaphroditum TaxID=289476 RepID=A0AA39LWK2_9BILA|nr:hypothetical protein QR680_006112 [Steinernema hermaphroditum]
MEALLEQVCETISAVQALALTYESAFEAAYDDETASVFQAIHDELQNLYHDLQLRIRMSRNMHGVVPQMHEEAMLEGCQLGLAIHDILNYLEFMLEAMSEIGGDLVDF